MLEFHTRKVVQVLLYRFLSKWEFSFSWLPGLSLSFFLLTYLSLSFWEAGLGWYIPSYIPYFFYYLIILIFFSLTYFLSPFFLLCPLLNFLSRTETGLAGGGWMDLSIFVHLGFWMESLYLYTMILHSFVRSISNRWSLLLFFLFFFFFSPLLSSQLYLLLTLSPFPFSLWWFEGTLLVNLDLLSLFLSPPFSISPHLSLYFRTLFSACDSFFLHSLFFLFFFCFSFCGI